MYRAIVKRRVRARFLGPLSEGDAEAMVEQTAPDIVHFFPGRGALAGTRRSREDLRSWFERLFRLIPRLEFTVDEIAVAGGPRHTHVMVRWHNWGEAADGKPYANTGCELIEMRWGRVTWLGAYLDTEVVSEALDRMAAAGITEAAAPPIGDPPEPIRNEVASGAAPG
jgi:ketosteroid isomerase-like protein